MDNLNALNGFLQEGSGIDSPLLFGIKAFAIVGLLIYLVFAVVVIRQVGLMTKTLEVGYERLMQLLALVHFVFAVATLVTAFVLL
jgi:hypothetical protein